MPDPHLDESEGGTLAGTAMESPGETAAVGSAGVYALGRQQPPTQLRARDGGTLSRQVLCGRHRLSHEPEQGCLHTTTLAAREEESLLEPRECFLNSAS